MNAAVHNVSYHVARLVMAAGLVLVTAMPVLAGNYDNALNGVKRFDAIYEVSTAEPKIANVVFWAVRDSYLSQDVKDLKGEPRIAIVFHGPAVKLISTDRGPFNAEQWSEVEKFQQTLREMKKEGVKLEVCIYAAKVLGVDKATILPEIDQVPNGFVSVIGYQMQDYAVVRVP